MTDDARIARDYVAEARAIVAGTSFLLAEERHLEVLLALLDPAQRRVLEAMRRFAGGWAVMPLSDDAEDVVGELVGHGWVRRLDDDTFVLTLAGRAVIEEESG